MSGRSRARMGLLREEWRAVGMEEKQDAAR